MSSSNRPATRSSARQAARQAESSRSAGASAAGSPTDPAPPPPAPRRSDPRKRKVTADLEVAPEPAPSARRSKRAKVSDHQPSQPAAAPAPPSQPAYSLRKRKGKQAPTMSSPEYEAFGIPSPELYQLTSSSSAAGPSIPPSENAHSASSSRKSSRSKKNAQGEICKPPARVEVAAADLYPVESASGSSSSNRRSRKKSNNADEDTPMTGTEENEKASAPPPPPAHDNNLDEDSEEHDDEDPRYDEHDDDDVFGGFGGPPGGLHSSLALLTGMMSGMGSRLREILANLRQKEDPSLHLIALNELSELLLVSNEDNLQGHFSADSFVRELVALMKPDDFMEANPEIMLLACRCLANLMEALPSSVTNVVYAGAVPVLCEKLRGIQFIDLAEQALSTLEKISVEYPSAIVKEGGLAACLEYLDFFAMSTQRTAVTTAANCCRNLPHDYFDVVKDAMKILRDVLKNSDQRVVEQASICVSRIVDTWRHNPSKLEALVTEDLLSSILRLLLPGSTNLISPNIHTQFLRVLASTARASPRLSVELMQMNVVETLYQVLTGVSPPNGTDDIASKLDSVLIMQALIHRPREQILEALNVICELLPKLPTGAADPTKGGFNEVAPRELNNGSPSTSRRRTSDEKRIQLLEGCKAEVRRFALILFPTLTDAFSSTVNLSVRQKVLLAQLKMLYNLDEEILTEALAPVPYASFLASILSQKDDLTLVTAALQATELLMTRLGSIYQYQLYREGVIAEISKVAEETEADAKALLRSKIHKDAKQFLETHETEKNAKSMKKRATKILTDLTELASEIEAFYLRPTSSGSIAGENGKMLFEKLATYFDSDLFESATSAELLASGVVRVLEEVFSNPDEDLAMAAQAAFIEVFMGYTVKSKPKTATADSPATPFSMMVHKLQDLLSRSEHFEVLTVSSAAHGDSHRSSPASMLAKQIRLKLVADDDSDIPKVYRNIMVSIHAIATFKSLEDYLRPRISLSDRPRPQRGNRESLTRALAAMTGGAFPFGAGSPSGSGRLPSRMPPQLGSATPPPPPPPVPPTASASRSSRKSKTSRSLPTAETPSTPDPASSAPGAKVMLRRSSRRSAAPAESPQANRAPPADEDDLEDALECADEKHITEDEGTPDRSALDTIVGDLDEDMGDAPTPDPSAVNLEVAAGGKITARKEDGTRVPTPSQGSSSTSANLAQRSSLLANALMNSPSPSAPSRSMSYAAAIQSVPQDWHLEFSHQGKVLTNDTTVYRAVQKPAIDANDYSSRNVWILTHEVKIRRVPGPPSAERISFGSTSNEESENGEGNSPASLAKHPSTASILRLLKILHNLNANIDDVLVENKATLKLNIEPLSQFVNTKLTSKLNRQLEEPLIVASNCLPSWSEDLARLYPFLFPFETRHLFLQSTSFGYARSMNRWQNAQSQEELRRNRDDRPFLGRLQRQKVRISRAKILESALKVMDLYGSSQSILEVEYFEEVGTGLGPTLEFYSTVSKEFAMKKLRLWRDADQNESDEYVSGPTGLFPRPLSEDDVSTPNGERILQLFRTLGKFTARSMIDSRIIDINFNPIFFRIGDETSGIKPSLGAMKLVDPVLARSLVLVKKFALAKKTIAEDPNKDATQKVNDIQNITVDNNVRVEDLSLDFTLPGYPEIDLVPNGSQIMLTIDNVDNYLERVIDMTLGSGVRRQVDAFRTGFSQVFPYSALRAFTPDELCTLFGRTDEDWSLATLMDSIKADHGFNMDSKSVRNLLQTMSEMTPVQRREFLQFTTGSPKLPIGGFKSLTPMFTVVCKPAEAPYTSDDYLPSVMTCANYLKLPDYTDVKVLQKRLFTATKEGQGAFHLS
ncbi:HECT-domain-containing protein [Diaporthe helianthi]|uniref:HECT-type E3 ubiquitin transferase n=1 Tax=Diaporthe helianthi TaxID=158607 RepID=A0A2P5ICH3_DIAHE|nr:HECT-domain-containing protein [Diaporthe helianthi]